MRSSNHLEYKLTHASPMFRWHICIHITFEFLSQWKLIEGKLSEITCLIKEQQQQQQERKLFFFFSSNLQLTKFWNVILIPNSFAWVSVCLTKFLIPLFLSFECYWTWNIFMQLVNYDGSVIMAINFHNTFRLDGFFFFFFSFLLFNVFRVKTMWKYVYRLMIVATVLSNTQEKENHHHRHSERFRMRAVSISSIQIAFVYGFVFKLKKSILLARHNEKIRLIRTNLPYMYM